MDLTLEQIIDNTDAIHRQLDNIENQTKVLDHLNNLKQLLNAVQQTHSKLSNIYNICNNKYKLITPHKTWAKKNTYTNLNKINRVQTKHTQLLTPDIPINVKVVNHIDEVPNIPLYWVSSINQYVININGIVFRGNIGNIYNKNHIKKTKKVHQIAICKYGNKCSNVLNGGMCKFYHDPLDLLQLVEQSKMAYDLFKQYSIKQRNFINTSWIYTNLPKNKNNNMMRHFGSKDALKHDFDLMKINTADTHTININNFRQQCMHDILVIMGMNQCDLIKHKHTNTDDYYDINNPFTSLSR